VDGVGGAAIEGAVAAVHDLGADVRKEAVDDFDALDGTKALERRGRRKAIDLCAIENGIRPDKAAFAVVVFTVRIRVCFVRAVLDNGRGFLAAADLRAQPRSDVRTR
jgi:hypothetical protein